MKHKPRHHLNFVRPARCSGKNIYPDKAQAEIVKREQELLTPGLKLKTYRCQAGCKGWHLTRRTEDR